MKILIQPVRNMSLVKSKSLEGCRSDCSSQCYAKCTNLGCPVKGFF